MDCNYFFRRSLSQLKVVFIGGMMILLSAGLTCASKKQKGKPKSSGKPYVLVSPQEFDRLEKTLMAEVAANRSQKCHRPVLQGKASPGQAEQDIIALLGTETGEVGACVKSVQAKQESLRQFLKGPILKVPEEFQDIIKQCSPLLEKVVSAVNHEDACSPYLAGKRGIPRFSRMLRITKALTLILRNDASRGEFAQAFDISTNWLRFLQDVSRGTGAPLIAALIGVACAKIIIEQGLREILSVASKIPIQALDKLMTHLTKLTETEPHFTIFLAQERQGFALQNILLQLKGEKWVPPGGYDEDFNPKGFLEGIRKKPGKSFEGVDPKEELTLVWISMDQQMRSLEKKCPADISTSACYQGVLAESKRTGGKAYTGQADRYGKILLSKAPNEEIRKWILDILQATGSAAYGKYVQRYGNRAFFYAAARLQAAILSQYLKAKVYPTPERLQKNELKRFLIDPNSQKEMQVKSLDKGIFEIIPSDAFPGDAGKSYRELRYSFQLPAIEPKKN